MPAFWILAFAAISYLVIVLYVPAPPVWKLMLIVAAIFVGIMAFFSRRSDV